MSAANSGTSTAAAEAKALAVITLEAKDLPAFCPSPSMPIWNHHPKVFLDVVTTGAAKCPYCGTGYQLIGGAAGHGH